MKVTFVHLGRENLGVEYLSSVLKGMGHVVSLAYDPGLFGLSDNVFYIPALERIFDRRKKVLSHLETQRPEVVAFSAYTGTYQWCLAIAREVKSRLGALTVFGGIHPTLVPEEVIRQPEVDYVVVGEAEEAFGELLLRLESGEKGNDVANVWLKHNGEIVANPVRPPILDLDALPLPDKSLFDKEVDFRDDYMILTARGCPFSCTYCCESYWNKLYRGRYFRRRSVGSVIQELQVMKDRYGFREVMFNDPIFFTHKEWLKELMCRYREKIGVPFRCFGKAGYLDEEIAQWLKMGGCYAIEFGMQSLNSSIRRDVLGRKESNDDYKKAFAILDKVGIRYDIDHMFGLPSETLGDHINAAIFYKNLSLLNRIKCHNLTYFPKMEIVRKAVGDGLLDEEDLDRISKGKMPADFFHRDSIKHLEQRTMAWDFLTIYRLIPILPRPILNWILKEGRWRGWRRIPMPLKLFGQILVAVRGKDYRYLLYVRYYALRLRLAMRDLPGLRRLFRACVWGMSALATIPIGNALHDWGAFHMAGIVLAGVAGWEAWRVLVGRGKA